MTVGSLFSGIGGFDLGFERARFKICWQVEIDPFCRLVLEKHWPAVARYHDVRDHGRDLEKVDVVCAGWPCQPVSSASHRHRYSTRHPDWLWPETLRIISTLRPTWFVGENVAALDRGELDMVVSDLESSGYQVGPPLEIPACAFGHDHRRARYWILGYTDGDRESGKSVNAKMAGMSQSRYDAARMGAPNGLSGRLDRRRMASLGNAIVPQVAEWIACHIRYVNRGRQ